MCAADSCLRRMGGQSAFVAQSFSASLEQNSHGWLAYCRVTCALGHSTDQLGGTCDVIQPIDNTPQRGIFHLRTMSQNRSPSNVTSSASMGSNSCAPREDFYGTCFLGRYHVVDGVAV